MTTLFEEREASRLRVRQRKLEHDLPRLLLDGRASASRRELMAALRDHWPKVMGQQLTRDETAAVVDRAMTIQRECRRIDPAELPDLALPKRKDSTVPTSDMVTLGPGKRMNKEQRTRVEKAADAIVAEHNGSQLLTNEAFADELANRARILMSAWSASNYYKDALARYERGNGKRTSKDGEPLTAPVKPSPTTSPASQASALGTVVQVTDKGSGKYHLFIDAPELPATVAFRAAAAAADILAGVTP